MRNLNYQSWEVKLSDGISLTKINDQIDFFLSFGLLAPSAHNGQPWAIKKNGNTVQVFIETERALLLSDPEGRQLSLGLGCFVENVFLAANYFGYVVDVKCIGGMDLTQPYLELGFKKTSEALNDKNHLANYITQRSTDRGEYVSANFPPSFSEIVTNFQTNEIKIFTIVDEVKKQQLSKITLDAQTEIMNGKDFRRELSELFKSNLTKSKIGMPGFAFAMPTLISFLGSFLLKNLNMSKLNRKIDDKIFTATPAHVIITTTGDDKTSWVNAGRVMEQVWLAAEREGLKCSPNASAIQIPRYRQEMQTVLDTNSFPVVYMRMGFSKNKLKHTPRFSLKDILING